jgi:hypothetical protein
LNSAIVILEFNHPHQSEHPCPETSITLQSRLRIQS